MAPDKGSASVHNCPVEFRFKCDKSWDNLKPTDRDNVRHCDQCRKKVYLVSTDAEIGWAIRTNKCIAWKLPANLQKEADCSFITLGEPHQHLGDLTKEVVNNAAKSEELRKRK